VRLLLSTLHISFFSSILPPPPSSTLFPYTTLFRSFTPETKNIVDAKIFAAMKPSSFFVNLARGGVVDEEALLDALRTRKIAGARSEEHTSELQSRFDLVCRLLLEKKKKNNKRQHMN